MKTAQTAHPEQRPTHGSQAFPVGPFMTLQVVLLHRKFNSQTRRLLERHGDLALPCWRILRIVGVGIAENTTAIRRCSATDKGQFSRSLASLVEDELVSLSDYPKDNRQMLVSLTEKGRAIYEQLSPDLDARHDHLLGSLTEDEITSFSTIMEKLHIAADEFEETLFSQTETGHSPV